MRQSHLISTFHMCWTLFRKALISRLEVFVLYLPSKHINLLTWSSIMIVHFDCTFSPIKLHISSDWILWDESCIIIMLVWMLSWPRVLKLIIDHSCRPVFNLMVSKLYLSNLKFYLHYSLFSKAHFSISMASPDYNPLESP